MLKNAVRVLLCLGVFTAISKAVTPWNEEQRWVSEMLDPSRYDLATRPVKNVTDVVEVNVEMVVFGILGLDSKSQHLTAVTSSNMGWEDKRLRWNSSDYSGMESIVVKANMVWYPNVLILNAINGATLIPSDTEVLITSEGELFVSTSRIHSTQCYIKQERFPFDTQECYFVLGTRGTPSDVIYLTASQRVHRTEPVRSTANWVLMERNVSHIETYSPTCIKHASASGDEVECRRSSQVRVIVCLHRVPKYYLYTVMAPITILTLMASFVFWLPPECGEKLSFGVSVFFGFVIFQLVLKDDLAATGDGKPSILIRYEFFNFLLTGVAVMESALTLILRNKNEDPEVRDRNITEETLKRNGNKSQEDNEVTPHMLQSAKRVPRNWKKIAVHVDRISFVLFWITYTVFLIVLIVETLNGTGECE